MKKSFLCFVTSLALLLASAGSNGQIVPRLRPITPLVEGADTVSVIIIGDVMMHSRQMEFDMNTFLEGIRPALESADIAIANMEFTLAGKPYTGYPSFSAPDEYASYVAGCGVDVFLTANNHILDKNSRGLERTLRIYRSMSDSVLFTGSASNAAERAATSPLIIDRKGIRLALVNFTYDTNYTSGSEWPEVNRMDTVRVKKYIERAKSAGADFILALPHWGDEFKLTHSSDQKKWAEWLSRQGVSAIVGSHPHVVQDSTHINGVPVFYSTGNAVSNMSAINTRLELAVKIGFIRDRVTRHMKMLEPEIRFMWCTLPGTLTDSYCTIFVDEWVGRRDEWKDPDDYDEMISTCRRVQSAAGIGSGYFTSAENSIF